MPDCGLPRIGPPARRSQVEPYLPFIRQTLEKFPTLTASRLYAGYANAATVAAAITSATSSPVTARARRQRPIYVCAACPASRRKSTGGILVIS
jgi:hypothetical protein